MRRASLILALLLAVAAWPPLPAGAQDRAETLADIRQQLTVLYVDLQRLKRELSTTGGVAAEAGGGTLIERVDLIEQQLVRLTARTEELENRIARIVADGTNRIGDLEFRLVELEGGDVSQLGETTTLGGEEITGPAVGAPVENGEGGSELAVAERSDFDRARDAYENGDYQQAAKLFRQFSDTYTAGPLNGDAHYWRGKALAGLGDTANAARAFLESFSGAPEGVHAPDALFELGLALGGLGQINEACITLAEVSARYPGTTAASDAVGAFGELGCR